MSIESVIQQVSRTCAWLYPRRKDAADNADVSYARLYCDRIQPEMLADHCWVTRVPMQPFPGKAYQFLEQRTDQCQLSVSIGNTIKSALTLNISLRRVLRLLMRGCIHAWYPFGNGSTLC